MTLLAQGLQGLGNKVKIDQKIVISGKKNMFQVKVEKISIKLLQWVL